MPQKNTNNKRTVKGQKRTLPTVSVRIDRMVDYPDSNIKAIASANIGGAFAIHGIRVVDSQKGLFVQMPQTGYKKDGKMQYREQFHPITANARNELNDKVLSAYEERLHMEENESQEMEESYEEETTDFEQSM